MSLSGQLCLINYVALTMWQNNGTQAWLQGKSDEEKQKLMESARKEASEVKQDTENEEKFYRAKNLRI